MAIDINGSTIAAFQSKDRLELLNDIDRFRQSELSGLPQIVVCGDTSSGKSSLLAALSGIPFPIDSILCTRFATEIALRYTSADTVTGNATITPGPQVEDDHRDFLKTFHEDITSLDTIPDLLRRAQDAMGITEAGGISRDVLNLKLEGRTLPNLTLVDLPGVIHASIAPDDDVKVRALVEHYFQQPESLILVVFSAENPIQSQQILELAHKHDPHGQRSIGVVTKPDVLRRPDKMRNTPAVLELARNQHPKYRFQREWQIVRCLTDDERERGANLDEIERDLFELDPWDSFDPRRLGINSLREVLCDYLQEHILRCLPNLIKSLEEKIAKAKGVLDALGPYRATEDEKKRYLTRIGERCGRLIRDALNGDYFNDDFFTIVAGKNETDTTPNRLRANTQKLNDRFEDAMRKRGRQYKLANTGGSTSTEESRLISVDEALHKVTKVIENNRGPELPGESRGLTRELFKEQSQSWPVLALKYTADVRSIVDMFLRKVVDATCPEAKRADAIFRKVFVGRVHEYHRKVDRKVHKLFAPDSGLYLFTNKGRLEANFYSVKTAWPSTYTGVGENDARVRALQKAEAYYNAHLDTFIDNVVVLAVEACLLSKLEHIFSSETVANLDPADIELLGGEPPEDTAARLRVTRNLQNLEEALQNCRSHASREFRLNFHNLPEVSPPRMSNGNLPGSSDSLLQSEETPSGRPNSSYLSPQPNGAQLATPVRTPSPHHPPQYSQTPVRHPPSTRRRNYQRPTPGGLSTIQRATPTPPSTLSADAVANNVALDFNRLRLQSNESSPTESNTNTSFEDRVKGLSNRLAPFETSVLHYSTSGSGIVQERFMCLRPLFDGTRSFEEDRLEDYEVNLQ